MRNKNLFWNKYGFPYEFPDVLDAIDCTHLAIIAPPTEHPVYPAAPFYRKSFYSLNVQIITDASLDMNARYPGWIHDSVSENE
jgi:hypothetical protein